MSENDEFFDLEDFRGIYTEMQGLWKQGFEPTVVQGYVSQIRK